MNSKEFVNMVKSLESVYGVFNAVYICHKDLYIGGLDIQLEEVLGSNYSMGEMKIGLKSRLSVLVSESKLYEGMNMIKIVTEKKEVIKIDL